MPRPIVTVLLVLALGPGSAAVAAPRTAQDRGCLSLAWDAHESGAFDEALRYLDEITPDSEVSRDAAWLRAECLYDLGRYREAAAVLESQASGAIEDLEAFLLDVYWDWAWSAIARENYPEALAILAGGRKRLPDDSHLAGLEEATRYRAELHRVIGQGRGTLPSGETVVITGQGTPPGGPDWHRVHPWDPESPWVPQTSLRNWMPSRVNALGERILWVRIPTELFKGRLESVAFVRGFAVQPSGDGFSLGSGGETVAVSVREWAYRAAVEGLGIRGAVESAIADAAERLESQSQLVAWVAERSGELQVSRVGRFVHLAHGGSGRTFDLDPGSWARLFLADPEGWQEFWTELSAELGRPARPYRCFCGRKASLREAVVADPGGALVFERVAGYSVVLLALCPLHQRYVTEDLLRSWGLPAREVWDRARADVREQPWAISFGRRVEGGVEGIVLEAEGVSGLARYPELLLGVLEKIQGVEARSTVVQVRVPASGTLVVAGSDAGETELRALAARSLLDAARRDHRLERLDYRVTVRLPGRGAGTFRVVPVDP